MTAITALAWRRAGNKIKSNKERLYQPFITEIDQKYITDDQQDYTAPFTF